MDSNNSYTREELLEVGDAEFPSRGEYCPKCKGYIPNFENLNEDKIADIWRLPANKREEELIDLTGCNKRWAKIWLLHRDGPNKK